MRTELVTTLKRKATEILSELENEKAPILITQYGKPAAYLVDVETYDDLQRPKSGSVPQELRGSRYRQIVEPPCRVFYRFDGKRVWILRVMRSERLLRACPASAALPENSTMQRPVKGLRPDHQKFSLIESVHMSTYRHEHFYPIP